jgi:hypothetical protein
LLDAHPKQLLSIVISVNDISMRFGARILFEDVAATFLRRIETWTS